MSNFTILLDGLSFAECPRWRNGLLYFSDRFTRQVLAASPDGELTTFARTTVCQPALDFSPVAVSLSLPRAIAKSSVANMTVYLLPSLPT